ncbi:hypothetical protein F5Y06DRAFT_298746 [Hypoxylon sp. FL0890]|nr:hypothetical protein F5Y06DRAFT_298746 [Hypoxylon sp. FL0890]
MFDAPGIPPKDACRLFSLLKSSSYHNPSREPSSEFPPSTYVPIKIVAPPTASQTLKHATSPNYTPRGQFSFNKDMIPIVVPGGSIVLRRIYTGVNKKQISKPSGYHEGGSRYCRSSQKLSALGLLAVAMTFWMPLVTAALILSGQELRIGSGIAAVTSAVSVIPLRRDERVGLPVLIPMYLVSLAATALFLVLQCRNISRYQGRYIFGTLVLTGHFVVGLSQTSASALDGILDFGPVILPVVAAALSLVFQRRRPVIVPGVSHSNPQGRNEDEEVDIGMVPLSAIVDF